MHNFFFWKSYAVFDIIYTNFKNIFFISYISRMVVFMFINLNRNIVFKQGIGKLKYN